MTMPNAKDEQHQPHAKVVTLKSSKTLLDAKTNSSIQGDTGLISSVLGKELSIVSLNNGGIDQISEGKPYEANLYFSRALLKVFGHDVDTRLFNAPSPKFKWKSLLNKPRKLLKKHLRMNRHQREQEESTSSTDTTVTPSSASSSASSSAAGQAASTSSADSRTTADSSSASPEESAASQQDYKKEYYDEGLHVFDKMVPIDPEITNKHLIAAIVVYNVGHVHLLKGEPEEANIWFASALRELKLFEEDEDEDENVPQQQQQQQLHHHHHPLVNIVICYHNMGRIYHLMGKQQRALAAYQMSYNEAIKLSQELNDETLLAKAMNSLAVFQQFYAAPSDQDPNFSARLLRQSYSRLRDHEEELPQLLATVLNNAGRVHFAQNEYVMALERYRQALEIRESVLGEDHLDVAMTMYSIGRVLHRQGQRNEAMEKYQKFLDIAQQHSLGHAHVTMSQKFMAQIHQSQKRHEQALEMFEAALESGTETLGEEHPEVAYFVIMIGSLTHLIGNDLRKALEYYKRGLEVGLRVLEKDHNDVLVTLDNMGKIYSQQEEHEVALDYYEQLLEAQERKFGEGDVVVSNTLSQMAWSEYKLRDYEVSMEYYQRALAIRRDHHGDEHFNVTASLRQIGVLFKKQGDYAEALDALWEALRLRINILGKDHSDVATIWCNIGAVYLEMGDEHKTIEYYTEAIRVQKAALGKDHDNVVRTLENLGNIYWDRGQLDMALAVFEEVLDIDVECRGRGHEVVANGLEAIGNIHLQRGQTVKFMECMSEALRIYRQLGKSYDTLVISGFESYDLYKRHPECAAIA